MKFLTYLNDSISINTEDDLLDRVKHIKKNCKKFLKDKLILYRGIYLGNEEGPGYKIKALKNRKPLDMPPFIHKILDDLFEKKFGWRVRSQGVPTTKNLEQTHEYGHPHYFFPIGDYKYAWNFDIIDLWFTIRAQFPFITRQNREKLNLSFFKEFGISKENLYNTLEFYVNGFSEKKPTALPGEVFVKCDEYYLLNVEDSIELFGSDEKGLIKLIWGK